MPPPKAVTLKCCGGAASRYRIKPEQDVDLTHLCKAMVAKKATVKGLFLSMDSDHSGTLSMAEFREGLRRLDCGTDTAVYGVRRR